MDSYRQPPFPGKKLHRDARREAIVKAAARAFRLNGYSATTIEHIMSAAKVSRTLIYRHFKTKKEIYTAILQEFSRLPGATQQDAATVNDKLAGFMQLAQNNPDAFLLTFRHAAREPEFHQYAERIEAKRTMYIEHMLRERIADPARRAFASVLICQASTNMLIVWAENDFPLSQKDITRLVLSTIDTIIQGLEQ